MKRPFWAHQLVEYLLGVGAVGMGAQSSRPLFPCIAGALLLLNAASTAGPLGAFRVVPRVIHRLFDGVLVVVLLAMAFAGGDRIDSSGRVVLVGLAVILAFVSWRTDYTVKVKRGFDTTGSARSEQFGRTAGRVTGNAVNMWRNRKRSS